MKSPSTEERPRAPLAEGPPVPARTTLLRAPSIWEGNGICQGRAAAPGGKDGSTRPWVPGLSPKPPRGPRPRGGRVPRRRPRARSVSWCWTAGAGERPPAAAWRDRTRGWTWVEVHRCLVPSQESVLIDVLVIGAIVFRGNAQSTLNQPVLLMAHILHLHWLTVSIPSSTHARRAIPFQTEVQRFLPQQQGRPGTFPGALVQFGGEGGNFRTVCVPVYVWCFTAGISFNCSELSFPENTLFYCNSLSTQVYGAFPLRA